MTLGLFGNRRDGLPTDDELQRSRWRIATFSQEGDEKKLRRKTVFSFWSAAKYVLILSLLLWWLPVFGQMIAGYVGGRKAGSPWRGVAAAILPVIAIFSVMTAIDCLFPSYAVGSGSASASLLTGIVSAVPFVGPYLDFTREYVSQFISSLQGASPYEMNSYLLTIAFAYVGGILADQARREIDAASGKAGNHTTVMVAPSLDERGYPVSYANPAAYPHATIWGFLPHFGFRRKPVIRSYEQLVPEEVELEEDEDRPVSKKKKVIKRRLANGGAVVSEYHQKHSHVGAADADKPRPVLKVSVRNPRTLLKAEKMIEKEWDPKRKKKNSPWIPGKEATVHNAGKAMVRIKNWESF